MKVRLSSRVQFWISGGELGQNPDALDRHGYGVDGQQLMLKVGRAREAKDGSVTIELTPGELDVLRELAQCMESCSGDNAWDKDGLADLNSARALLRRLHTV